MDHGTERSSTGAALIKVEYGFTGLSFRSVTIILRLAGKEACLEAWFGRPMRENYKKLPASAEFGVVV
jgi:hypothetical protein